MNFLSSMIAMQRVTRVSLSISGSGTNPATVATVAGTGATGECSCEHVCGPGNTLSRSAAISAESIVAAANSAAAAAALDPGESHPGSDNSGDGHAAPDWRRSPHVNQTALASYRPSLSSREMDRAIFSVGDTSRLRRVAAKLLAGKAHQRCLPGRQPDSVSSRVFSGAERGPACCARGAHDRPAQYAVCLALACSGFAADRIGETNFAARFLAWVADTFPGAPPAG